MTPALLDGMGNLRTLPPGGVGDQEDQGHFVTMTKKMFGFLIVFSMVATLSAGVLPPITATNGSSFSVDYNGYTSDDGVVSGLTSQVNFSNFLFADDAGTNQTIVTFDFEVVNTSSAPVTDSRISGLGFLTTPNVAGGDVTGVFDSVVFGSDFPQSTPLEFCFTSGPSCPGGAGVGVGFGASDTGSATLFIAGLNQTELTFDGLFVRYQSIAGEGITGTSGVGTAIPEPGTYGLLSLALGGLFMLHRRRQARRNAVG